MKTPNRIVSVAVLSALLLSLAHAGTALKQRRRSTDERQLLLVRAMLEDELVSSERSAILIAELLDARRLQIFHGVRP